MALSKYGINIIIFIVIEKLSGRGVRGVGLGEGREVRWQRVPRPVAAGEAAPPARPAPRAAPAPRSVRAQPPYRFRSCPTTDNFNCYLNTRLTIVRRVNWFIIVH